MTALMTLMLPIAIAAYAIYVKDIARNALEQIDPKFGWTDGYR